MATHCRDSGVRMCSGSALVAIVGVRAWTGRVWRSCPLAARCVADTNGKEATGKAHLELLICAAGPGVSRRTAVKQLFVQGDLSQRLRQLSRRTLPDACTSRT